MSTAKVDLGGIDTTIRRIPAPHLVNGEAVGFVADRHDRDIAVTDDGNSDALVVRTANAVAAYLIDEPPAADEHGDPPGGSISPIDGPLPGCPLIPPDADLPRLF